MEPTGLLRFRIDEGRCQGHGLCYGLDPERLDCDEMGHAVPLEHAEPPSRRAEMQRVAAACPEQAIEVTSVESS